MSSKPKYWAVVPAAGIGARMEADRPKQYLPLLGSTVIEHSLSALLAIPELESITVAIAKDDPYWPDLNITQHPKVRAAAGGRERADSVLNGLLSLDECAQDQDWVLVHDAARPCVSKSALDELLKQCSPLDVGGILAVPVNDTVKSVGPEQTIEATVDRSRLWAAQTPQMFRYGLLRKALTDGLAKGLAITDEASAIEQAGMSAKVIASSTDNIKITRPEDLALAEFILSRKRT